MRTLNCAFLVVSEGKNLVKKFLAIVAEELVVGHGDLHLLKGNRKL